MCVLADVAREDTPGRTRCWLSVSSWLGRPGAYGIAVARARADGAALATSAKWAFRCPSPAPTGARISARLHMRLRAAALGGLPANDVN